MGRIVLTFGLILPGAIGAAIFGYYALIDWDALQKAQVAFELAAQQSAGLNTLFVRATQQNIHRINLFAEGVWFLLSTIVIAIGLHGFCTASSRSRG
ncbi:MAG: hypothetical protein ACFBSF_12435 [Leptolyngbyaceae cyanobacterium]